MLFDNNYIIIPHSYILHYQLLSHLILSVPVGQPGQRFCVMCVYIYIFFFFSFTYFNFWLHWVSVVACGFSLAVAGGLRSTWALCVVVMSWPSSMIWVPRPGIESLSPALKGGILTTGPLGKPPSIFIKKRYMYLLAFIFDCAGSSLLCRLPLAAVLRLPTAVASLDSEHSC